MGNWWKIKSKNYDSIIFYKVGKFYELYHMDAGVGVTHCGLTFMRGKFAHAGFPEVRFEHFTSMLLNKGFKVARVEQTETQEQNKERVKRSEDWVGKKKSLSKFEKQTRREVCRIETPGTKIIIKTSYDSFFQGLVWPTSHRKLWNQPRNYLLQFSKRMAPLEYV